LILIHQMSSRERAQVSQSPSWALKPYRPDQNLPKECKRQKKVRKH
jgi:hypothetical protein